MTTSIRKQRTIMRRFAMGRLAQPAQTGIKNKNRETGCSISGAEQFISNVEVVATYVSIATILKRVDAHNCSDSANYNTEYFPTCISAF